jgi:hypothetical protein
MGLRRPENHSSIRRVAFFFSIQSRAHKPNKLTYPVVLTASSNLSFFWVSLENSLILLVQLGGSGVEKAMGKTVLIA